METKVVVHPIADHLVLLDHINADRVFMAVGRAPDEYYVLTTNSYGSYWHKFSKANTVVPPNGNKLTVFQTVRNAVEAALILDWQVHEIDTTYFLRSK